MNTHVHTHTHTHTGIYIFIYIYIYLYICKSVLSATVSVGYRGESARVESAALSLSVSVAWMRSVCNCRGHRLCSCSAFPTVSSL